MYFLIGHRSPLLGIGRQLKADVAAQQASVRGGERGFMREGGKDE